VNIEEIEKELNQYHEIRICSAKKLISEVKRLREVLEVAPDVTDLIDRAEATEAQLAEKDRQIEGLKKALRKMIFALRNQVQLARQCGGDIAIWEGNARAWDIARQALAEKGAADGR